MANNLSTVEYGNHSTLERPLKVDFSDVSISNHDLNEWDVDYKRINDDVASRLLKDEFCSLVVKKHLTGNTTQALSKESGNEVITLKLREANELFLDSKVRNIERGYKVACEKAAFLERSLLTIHDSVAWKITKPIRFFSSLF